MSLGQGEIPASFFEGGYLADIADIAQEQQEREEEWRKVSPYVLPQGMPGDCRVCEEFSPRLIKGVCAPCRDKYGLG